MICIFRQCKMSNLCVGSHSVSPHCVGASLDRQGYTIDGFGNIVEKSKEQLIEEQAMEARMTQTH